MYWRPFGSYSGSGGDQRGLVIGSWRLLKCKHREGRHTKRRGISKVTVNWTSVGNLQGLWRIATTSHNYQSSPPCFTSPANKSISLFFSERSRCLKSHLMIIFFVDETIHIFMENSTTWLSLWTFEFFFYQRTMTMI